MTGLSTAALLSGWERGLAEPYSIGRSLALLSVASPDATRVSLDEMSIGERDSLLLKVREQLWGSHIDALAVCAGCGQRVEFSFDLSEVRVGPPAEMNSHLSTSWEEYRVQFRLPNSCDLLVLGGPDDIGTKRIQLLQRVVLHAEHSSRPIAVQEFPEELVSALESEMQKADPQAEVNLKLRCQSCGHEWSALFDVGSFLWQEVDAWALRVLREVDALARAYGWREADILAMTPWRRHAYLEMLSS